MSCLTIFPHCAPQLSLEAMALAGHKMLSSRGAQRAASTASARRTSVQVHASAKQVLITGGNTGKCQAASWALFGPRPLG